jgi:saccharopine dehydrogenase-like NADP-dependent oxidoreductase
MKKVIVLGVGLVGKAMARDLARDYQVTVADINGEALEQLRHENPAIQTREEDLSQASKIQKLIVGQDLVIGALPGFMAFSMLKTVIESKKNIVDISFFAEDALELDAVAQKNQVTAVVDCGVAPGMDNIILGYHYQTMQVESFECLVGGLPVVRHWPYAYKAPFSPIDVIAEYTRPARLVENGHIVVRPALSDAEYIDFDEVGTLEAFNTDGLRSLIKTMKIPNMKEKTLRYPGHIEYIKVLRETGFFDEKPVQVRGASVRPIDVTAKLLFPKWQLGKDEEEFTIMRVSVQGKEQGNNKRYVYHLLDRYDKKTHTSSMARTTGYTATAVSHLVLEGHFTRAGVCPPEYVGADTAAFRQVLAYLKERNVNYVAQEHLE